MSIIHEVSEDTRILFGRLIKTEHNDLVAYSEMERLTGKPLHKIRGALMTARRQARRENRLVFGVRRGEGIVRLTDEEIVNAATADRKAIRIKSTRAAAKLSCADYSMLSNAKQLVASAASSLFLASAWAMKDNTTSALQTLGGSSKSLPIKETLRALLNTHEN